MRARNRETVPDGTPRTNRRSMISGSVCAILTAHGATTGAIAELFRVDRTHHREHIAPLFRAEILRLLRNEFPRIVVLPKQPTPETRNRCLCPDMNAWDIAQRLWTHIMIQKETERPEGVRNPVKYTKEYRRSREECHAVPEEYLDCNDFTNWVCEYLDTYGVPMYMISIWARNPADGFRKWHILAACKLGHRDYVIVDNARNVTMWRGSLGAFVDEYDSSGVTEVPCGISRYEKPHYDCPASRYALQYLHAIGSEEDIEVVERRPKTGNLARTEGVGASPVGI